MIGLVRAYDGTGFVVIGAILFLVLVLCFSLFRRNEKLRPDRTSVTCKDCGYPLRGLPADRCPECGAHFDPGTGIAPDLNGYNAKTYHARRAVLIGIMVFVIACGVVCAGYFEWVIQLL